jgi:tRNA 2-thiouridine synthesizing protein E
LTPSGPADIFAAGISPVFRRAFLMPHFEHGAIKVEIDENGFLTQPDCWTEQVAVAFADVEGIGALTDDHWKIMNYLRTYHTQFGVAPMIRKLCKETGFSLAQIYELFPAGPAKGACKVAGLPKPTGCV